MECKCCKSDNLKSKYISGNKYFQCSDCNLLFSDIHSGNPTTEKIKKHYKIIDPYEQVALSKKRFFIKALDKIDLKKEDRRILDIGCGYGYFLELANKKGWKVSGIEIIDGAIGVLKEKFIDSNTFYSSLEEANFSSNHFDAITLWDVLVLIDDPEKVLKECFRILKQNGKIGIRVRNVFFQKFAYYIFSHLQILVTKFGIKNPSVFHKYCFSSISINKLLSRSKYKNIKISNSPLTSGDPYGHSTVHFTVKLLKILIYIISNLVYFLTKKKLIIGPSLLIWAEKPCTE
ncbi:MAG: methyltransferase domain-containing protein [Ignavibacteriaceae bacterium]